MTNAPQRILVVANETVTGRVLLEAIEVLAATADTEVLALAPALNSKFAHWTSSDDNARRAAEIRLARCVELLSAAGLRAEGLVGDADPLQAVEDALRLFPANQIVIATHLEERSNWLARDIVNRAREQFRRPILHIVVDVEREREYLSAGGVVVRR
jgi:GABA permease